MQKERLCPSDLGIAGSGKVYRNLSAPALVKEALRRNEGELTVTGALCVNTGKYTGRSPDDKFLVDAPEVHDRIDWGEINRPISVERFGRLRDKMLAYLQNKDLYIFDGIAGASEDCCQRFRIINEYAYQNLFARNLLIVPTEEQLEHFRPDWTIIAAPDFSCIPEEDGVHSETAIILDFVSRTVLIAGNMYCGEIKKSIFTVMNYILPEKGILPMHCSANTDENGNCAIFFGLSGTGKTTLSSDQKRILIGDDEHGWADECIFNIEGGCYAKCIDLSREAEPQIYDAIRFGTVLENVILNSDGKPDYSDHSLTYNTRAGYTIENIANACIDGVTGTPNTILFLTADAFGVIPPISKLNADSAIYHYMSGYTSKVSGTERGISEPVATFSTMFGAPFFPLKTAVYAELFHKKLTEGGANVFLVNTGWYGGKAGETDRMKLRYTRAMVTAAISGELNTVEYVHNDILNVDIPKHCPDVPDEILDPVKAWGSEERFTKEAAHLAKMFQENFDRKFPELPENIKNAGPKS